MASLSRTASALMRPLLSINTAQICAQCRRSFLTSQPLQSGHNKWSKIKHEKAANDRKKNTMRATFGKDIAILSKLYGANPNMNPQLAAMVEKAKKASVPKAVIDGAIARGQGRSLTGGVLESMTLEFVMPPSTALIVDLETENKIRVLQEINLMVKKAKGATGSSKFFFTRAGRVTFEKSSDEIGIDEIMDDAIEAGAEDLETDADGNLVIWTEPSKTTQVTKAIAGKFGLNVLGSGIVWSANEETKTKLDSSDDLTNLADLLCQLREYPDVRAVYSNASKGAVSDDEWESIEEHLDI